MSDAIDTLTYKGFTIEVHYDQDSGNDSPRDWDNATTLVLSRGSRYRLPNEADVDFDAFDGWAEVERHLIRDHKARVILPVSCTDHSGDAYYIGAPQDPWDSGRIGFIFMTAEQICETYMVKRITKEIEAKAVELMTNDISVFSQWANGYVYGYVIKDEAGNEIDGSCWGIYDDSCDWSYLRSEAEAEIDGEIAHRVAVAAQKEIDDAKLLVFS